MTARARFAPFVLAILLVAACGGSSFDVGDTPGDAATSDGATEDAPTNDAGDSAAPPDVAACGDAGTVTTDGVQCTYAYDAYNASPSVATNSKATWSCGSGKRNLVGNGIPDHDTGTFPNPHCPNTISARSVSASMTLTPALAAASTTLHIVGYAFNGVKFDPSTAGTCTVSGGSTTCSLIGNTGAWHIEALGQKSFDFGTDSSNAHVQPDGSYHYHGMPEGLLGRLAKGKSMTLVGFAMDGFPVYARYGYSDAKDAGSGVKELRGSYALEASPDPGRPSTDTYPMGAFSEDYEYRAGSGDLDECNGRYGVTPEFPCGTYYYAITDTYPFIGRCVKGTAPAPGPGGPPPGDGGMPPPPP